MGMIACIRSHNASGIRYRENLVIYCLLTRFVYQIMRFSDSPLNPLLAYWQNQPEAGNPLVTLIKGEIRRILAASPHLAAANLSAKDTIEHSGFINLLMSPLYPIQNNTTDFVAMMSPFSSTKVLASPMYDRLEFPSADIAKIMRLRTTIAYLKIFAEVYDFALNFAPPQLISQTRVTNGEFAEYFQVEFDCDYCRVIASGAPELTAADKATILENLDNVNLWQRMVPPRHFTFEGVIFSRGTRITQSYFESRIKKNLLEVSYFLATPVFQDLEDNLRALLKRPNIEMSISTLLPHGTSEQFVRYSHPEEGTNCLFRDSKHFTHDDFANSVFAQALKLRKTMVHTDFKQTADSHTVAKFLGQRDIKSLLIAPLFHQEQLVGFLDLSSRVAHDLSYLLVEHLEGILPLFSSALRRAIDGLLTRFQGIIKDNCTAIHPAVEWKFQDAALQAYANQKDHLSPTMEPIVFHNVYPLYGMSDIRSSSTLRNDAIQKDLTQQLKQGQRILDQAHAARSMPAFKELSFRLQKNLRSVSTGLNVGEEISIFQFLKHELEPIFGLLGSINSGVSAAIADYQSSVNPKMGMVYNARHDYEISVSTLNQRVARFVDEEQEKAQEMFPHYFEKQSTDGVDHSIYIGPTLVRDLAFDPIHLKNLRLWQLILMCGIEKICCNSQKDLPVKLQLAHLIAVQDNPISIRFDYQEKQFGVEGAYNIRYEILKKRIDKAVIKGSGQRLTQPGQIAIVFTQEKERLEYLRYVDFLTHEGYVKGTSEEFELDDLQGIHGLRALRIAIKV